MKIGKTVCILFCFLVQFSFAQKSNIGNFSITPLGNNKGLNSSDISALYQDRDGYIWAGTKPGISKFDGYEFTNFTKANETYLGQIHSIVEDVNGILWAGGVNGLFYYFEGQFHEAKIGTYAIQSLLLDKNKQLWVGGLGFAPFVLTTKDIERIAKGDVFEPKPFVSRSEWMEKIGSLRVWAMDIDNDNNIYFGLDNRHAYYDGNQLNVTWIDSSAQPEYCAIAAYSPDSIYWGSEEVPLTLTNKQGLHILNDRATYIVEKTDSTTFFLSTTDLLEITNEGLISRHEFSTYSGLYFQDMILDREGNFWIGAPGELLKLTPNYIKTWTNVDYDLLHSNHSLAQLNNEDIIIGSTRKDVLRVEDDGFGMYTQLNARFNSFTSCIYPDENGWIWYGTSMSGLFLERDDLQLNYSTDEGLVDKGIYFIKKSKSGSLWAGGEHGISKVLIDNNKEVTFENYRSDLEELDFPLFQSIIESPKGIVWAVGDKGLSVVNNNKLKRWSFPEPATPYPIFTGVASDAKGHFWLSTQGEGLWQCHFNNQDQPELIKQWGSADGLLTDVVLNVLVDKTNQIWSIGQNGICRLNTNSPQKIVCLDESDGWLNIPASHFAATESKNGNFWAVSGTGLISFPLYDLPENGLKPKAFITKILLSEGKEDVYTYSKNDNRAVLPEALSLPYNRNFLRFNYTTTSHTNTSKNLFKYRLNGLDPDWNESTVNRSVLYPGLKPGRYSFEVIAMNNQGLPSEKSAIFNFEINPPWYMTWWAYVLYIFSIGTLIYWFYNFNLKRKLALAESQKLKEIDQLKNNLYANITHEFRTPLTVILGMADSLKSEISEDNKVAAINSIDMIDRNGRSLLNLINEMLDLSKLESGKMELNLIRSNIIPFLKYLAESFQSYAEEMGINLTIYSEIHELDMDFDPQKMSIVITNLLSNAIKFTNPGGKIIVHAYLKKEGLLSVKVVDTGIGLSEAEVSSVFDRFYQAKNSKNITQTGTGIGLALTKELVDLMGGDIKLKSIPGDGSTFEVLLPITKNAVKTSEADFQLADLIVPSNSVRVSRKNGDILGQDSELPLALIIEDNEDVASYIRSCLDGRYRTLLAINGQEGVDLAFDKIPDIIISDVMMPEKNGFEVCEELKTDDRTDHIPIVMLTAKVTVKDRIAGLSHGADAYLAKPFVKAELLTRLDQLILLRKKLLQKIGGNSYNQILSSQAQSPETKFLQKVIQLIHQDLDRPSLNAAYLAHKLRLSESQVYRKLKATSGKSTAIFIRSVRLQKGKEMLQTSDKTISEVAYGVGFSDPSYFSRAFKEEFGYAPNAVSK